MTIDPAQHVKCAIQHVNILGPWTDERPEGNLAYAICSAEAVPDHAVVVYERLYVPEIVGVCVVPPALVPLLTGDHWQFRPGEVPEVHEPRRLGRRSLDRLPLGQIQLAAQAELRAMADDLSATLRDEGSEGPVMFADEVPRPGRPPLPDVEYALAAEAYDIGCTNGRGVAEIAATLGLDPAQLHHRLRMARRRGFLTPSLGQGVRGGKLMPKGRRVLASSAEAGS